MVAKRLLIFCSFIIAGFFVGTQIVAYQFIYNQEVMGIPLVSFETSRVFAPHKIVEWDLTFGENYKSDFLYGYSFVLAGLILGFIYLFISKAQQQNVRFESMPYGTARWANRKDLKESGLLNREGVVLGIDNKGRYLRDNSDRHIKIFAPTRSGKGVGIVVPTLLTWPQSAVIFDPKGENYNVTSGYRARFSDVIYFNPTDTNSAKFNPLLEVRKGDNEVKDAQNIADMTVDPDGKGLADHWARTSHSLLVGAMLHVLYAEKRKSLAGVADLLSNPKMTIEETLEMMMHAPHYSNGSTHEVVARTARDMLNKSFEERSGVLSTAMAHLALYRDPILARATETSDFKIDQFVSNERPTSLYIVIPGSDISRLRPLTRLIINQFCKRLTERLEYEEVHTKGRTSLKLKPRRQRLLFLLDEFPVLGKLDFFETSLAYMAQYGMKAVLFSQSQTQIVKEYTANNSIIDNCHIRIVHAPNNIETAEVISRMLGQTTAKSKSKNYGGNRLGLSLGRTSEGEQQTGRPLLTAGEVSALDKNKQIIFVGNLPPILCNKLTYYTDENFLSRLCLPPAHGFKCAERSRNDNEQDTWDLSGSDSRTGLNDLFQFNSDETEYSGSGPQQDLPFYVTGKRRKEPGRRTERLEEEDTKFLLKDI